jgi:hypothetical protein
MSLYKIMFMFVNMFIFWNYFPHMREKYATFVFLSLAYFI